MKLDFSALMKAGHYDIVAANLFPDKPAEAALMVSLLRLGFEMGVGEGLARCERGMSGVFAKCAS